MVSLSADVQFPRRTVGHLSGGENLRSLIPKKRRGEHSGKSRSSVTGGNDGGIKTETAGYCLQLTYDVPQDIYNGVLHVCVCWHDILYRSDAHFAQSQLMY
jgi:hypothetical protein